MLRVQEKLQFITHPLISSIHMKREIGKNQDDEEDVLVIETCFPEDEYESFDTYLMDLLIDLEDLKNQAERRVGTFDRVDIRAR